MQDIAEKLLEQYSRQQIAQLINLLLPQAPTGTMTAKEFGHLQAKMDRKLNSYSETSIAIARLHYCEGASISEAAREKGVSYQCAHAVIRRIETKLL